MPRSSSQTNHFALGPVIAIIAQPLLWADGQHSQYIAASYVRWLESAGARTVPLSYYASDDEADDVFEQVNGALFPGGGANTPGVARRLYKRAVAAHANGDHFPIWGSCAGFEWLMQTAAGNDSVLTDGFDAENMSVPLNLTAAAAASTILAEAARMPILGVAPPTTVLQALDSLPLTLNNHHEAVTPKDFEAFANLPAAFSVLATNVDRAGRPFVAMVEGKGGLPVWATQFHPEKNIWEQGMQLPSGAPFEHIAHSLEAVAMSQFFANHFVRHARASAHRFKSADEAWRRLLYAGKDDDRVSTIASPAFVEIYTFRKL